MANWKKYSSQSKKDPVKGWFIGLTCVMLLLLSVYKVVIYSHVTEKTFDNVIMSWVFSVILALSLEALRGLVTFIGARDFERGRFKLALFGLFVSLTITGWDVREAVIHNFFGSSENNWIMGLLSVLVIILEIRVGLYFAGSEKNNQNEHERNKAGYEKENKELREKLEQALKSNASLNSKINVLQDEEVNEAFKKAKAKHDKAGQTNESVVSVPSKRRKNRGEKDKEVVRLDRNIRQWKHREKIAVEALKIAEANEDYEEAAKQRDRIQECENTKKKYEAELANYKASRQPSV